MLSACHNAAQQMMETTHHSPAGAGTLAYISCILGVRESS